MQGVGHQRAHARAAGRGRDFFRPGEAHEIPDNEKIVGESELVDYGKLSLQAGRDFLGKFSVLEAIRAIGVALVEPGQAQFAEIIFRLLGFRRRKDGEMPAAKLQFDIDRVGDLLRAANGVFLAGEGGVHFFRAAQIKLVGFHAHAVGVGAELARVDAQENVLGLGVFAQDVVHVAGGHGGHAHLPGQIDRGRKRDRCDSRPLFWISM